MFSDKNSRCPVVVVIFEFGRVFVDNVFFENRRDLEYNWSGLHIAGFFLGDAGNMIRFRGRCTSTSLIALGSSSKPSLKKVS